MRPSSHAVREVHTRRAAWLPLLLPLLAALCMRLLVWWTLPYRGQISDEAEYLAAATWLAQGRGFSFYKDWIWTRPPVYLLFLAPHIWLFGPANLVPIRISQALLGVATVALAMAWGAMLAAPGKERRVALLVGWAMALAYSLATYAFLLLSETLFIALLLLGLLLLTLWAADLTPHPGGTDLTPRPPSLRGKGEQDSPPVIGEKFRTTGLLLAAGIVLGLCVLTRALLAGALPLFATWVWWQATRTSRTSPPTPPLPGEGAGGLGPSPGRLGRLRVWRGLGQAVLFTLAVLAVILPWSVYNSRFFDGAIAIDTTGGYNAMLGAQAAHLEIEARQACATLTDGRGTPGQEPCPAPALRDEKVVHDTLIQVPNHAERQQVAYSTAWQWIRENPAGFMRKIGRELLDLLMINYGGAERLAGGYTFGEVPLPHLLGLLLDDTLYFLAVPLAIIGLARPQRRPGKGLALMWLGYNFGAGPLFFAINRFRLPLLPILFIYAACGIVQAREYWSSGIRSRVAIYGASALFALLLPSFLYWPPILDDDRRSALHDTYLGLKSRLVAQDCTRGEVALERGDVEAAQRFHDRANARMQLDCLALLQARIHMHNSDPEAALALLQSMRRTPERFLLEGAIYRRLGRQERAVEAFVGRELEQANPTRWAWNNLAPPPTTRIDLGSGLDWGYVDGFYTREGRAEDPGNFRWSSGTARLRFVGAGTGAPQMLHLRVAGPTPPEAPAHLTISQRLPDRICPAQERVCAGIQFDGIGPEWQTIEVPLLATSPGEDVLIEFQSTVFAPHPDDLARRQQAREKLRLLGVKVDWAEVSRQQLAGGSGG